MKRSVLDLGRLNVRIRTSLDEQQSEVAARRCLALLVRQVGQFDIDGVALALEYLPLLYCDLVQCIDCALQSSNIIIFYICFILRLIFE